MPTPGDVCELDTAVTEVPTTRRGRQQTGVVLLLLAAVLWSVSGVFVKTLHSGGLNAWVIAGFRSLFAGAILTPFAVRRLAPIREPAWFAAALLTFTGMCATFVISTTMTTAANAIALQSTAPIWVFLFAPLIVGDKASGRHYRSLLFSLTGVAVIFLSQYKIGHSGLLIALSSGFIFGMQSVFFRRVRAVDPVVMAWAACTVSGVLLVTVAYFVDTVTLSWPEAGWLAVMGVVQFAIPYVLYSAGLRSVSAQRAVLLILLEPVLNPVWVWLIVREVPHWGTVIGGILILASVVYVSLLRTRRPTPMAVTPTDP